MILSDRVQAFLRPIVGDAVARRLILSYCAQRNMLPKEIHPTDLPDLGEYFIHNLSLFVGKERAQCVFVRLVDLFEKSRPEEEV